MTECERCGEDEGFHGSEWKGLMCLDCYYSDKREQVEAVGGYQNPEVTPYTYSAALLRYEVDNLRYAMREIRMLIKNYYEGLVLDGPALVEDIERVVMEYFLVHENEKTEEE